MSKIVTMIPVRMASSRLPNKPLIDINGKTLIRRVYENVKKIVPVRLNEDTNVDIIEKIAKPFNKLFPDVTLSRKVQTTNSTYEYYRHKSGIVKRIANDSTESEKGKYKF